MTVILASLPYNGLWAVDFTVKGVNKGSGIARMGEMLGVAPSAMACVGDSYNDLPMLAGLRPAHRHGRRPRRNPAGGGIDGPNGGRGRLGPRH